MRDQDIGTDRRLEPEGSLVRALGTWGLAAAIVNVTIGAGIFRLPSSVAASLGPVAPLAYLLCALAMGLIVLCFAEAGSRVSMTGGPYAYVEVAFGRFVGFLCGVLLWAGLTAALAAVTSFFADSVAALIPAFGSRTPKVLVMLVVLAAIAIQTLIVATLAVTGSFERLAVIANGSVLLVYAACCLATVQLRRRDVRSGGIPFRVPAAGIVPWLALLVILALLATVQAGEWLAVAAVVLAAALVYALTHSRRHVPAPEPVGD